MAHPGEIIAKWMSARGLSEGDVARGSKVPQPTIHRIITGESRDPRRSNLEKIAKFFGCSIDDLYDKKAQPGEVQLDQRAEEFARLVNSLSDEQYEIVYRMILQFRKQASTESRLESGTGNGLKPASPGTLTTMSGSTARHSLQ
jgi:transcriptional regulator with XRE-family HTH domain